ncbi:MAG: hypothetical protein KGH69_04515 [Candidatus Micrarchaeota archaeon]|nr:hypothetical protein [Candidatus Micrarchaeota archaeon]
MADGSEAKIKELIEKAEISLILDTYDDIFSDFDPRSYAERALSVDFLSETRREARDKDTGIELNLLIPKAARNLADEETIKTRLKAYFRKSYRYAKEELSKRSRQALALVVVGVVIGTADVYMLSLEGISPILKSAIEVVLTPASWYTLWTGFDELMIKPREAEAEKAFYKKMSAAQIIFTPY